MRPQSRWAFIRPAICERRRIKRVDHGAGARQKGDMGAISSRRCSAVKGWADEKLGARRFPPCRAAVSLQKKRKLKRAGNGEIERFRGRPIIRAERNMAEQQLAPL